MDRNDVEYMIEEGPLAYIKMRANTAHLPAVGSKIYSTIKTSIHGLAKFFIMYYLLLSVFNHVGMDKFLIMLVAGFIASKIFTGDKK